MSKKIAKGGFTLVELLVVDAIICLLMGLLIPAFAKVTELLSRLRFLDTFGTEIEAKIIPADPQTKIGSRAVIVYEVNNCWGCEKVEFKDIISSGEDLDEIVCLIDNEIVLLDSNTDYSSLNLPPWSAWLERFDETRKEYSTGLKPNAECFLKAKALRDNEGKKTEEP